MYQRSTFKPYTDAKAEKDFGLTSAQMGKIATNVGGTVQPLP